MCVYFNSEENKENNKITTHVLVTCTNCHRPIMRFTTPYTDYPTIDMIECATINKLITTHNTYCASCGELLNNSDEENGTFEITCPEQHFA